jgi:hypothetical protein
MSGPTDGKAGAAGKVVPVGDESVLGPGCRERGPRPCCSQVGKPAIKITKAAK